MTGLQIINAIAAASGAIGGTLGGVSGLAVSGDVQVAFGCAALVLAAISAGAGAAARALAHPAA